MGSYTLPNAVFTILKSKLKNGLKTSTRFLFHYFDLSGAWGICGRGL